MASCTTAAAAFSLPNLSYGTGSDGVQRHGRRRRRRQVSFALPSSSSKGDLQFLRQGLRWVKSSPHLSGLSTTVSRTFWLRFLEDPGASSSSTFPIPPWPSPSYPGLSGMDLLMADLEALKLYAFHLHQLTKIWSMPLPETYDPQIIAFYFSCRPHVLVLRVLEILASFASAAIKMRTSSILKFNKIGLEEDEIGNSSDYYIGHLLKETMLNLGPTFIKVGQSLSTRPDITGSEISKVLSELNENIPPFPREVAVDIIEQEFGSPVKSIFSYISEKPVASASFGQVYRGSTLDGCDVAVKVQRPNLLHAVVRDIYILRLGLGVLRKVAKRKSDLCLYADELGKGLVGELDYRIEAANALEFQVAHARFSFISVPKVYRHLSKKRVLTMEWMAGENPSELLFMSQDPGHQVVGNLPRQKLEAQKRLLDLINKGVEASLVQLLETGLLHADPHTGNLRYTNEGHIGFLDFGLLCRMEKKHQFAMLAFIVHIINGDWGAVVHDLTEMDVVRPGPNLLRVTMDLEEALGEVDFKCGIPDIKFSKVLGKIWSIALRYHFRMPPYYTLVLRSLASLEGLAVAADPDFMTFQAACPYVVQKLLSDNSAPMRRILHSAVFNKRKEFEWERLAMYLKIGSRRKSMHGLLNLDPEDQLGHTTNRSGLFETADAILRLLTSKNGAVLRRLLMTVDSASLTRAMISKDGLFFRQHLSQALAQVIFQWMSRALGGDLQSAGVSGSPGSSAPVLQAVLTDRRLKLIFYKHLNSIKTDPLLVTRFCWALLTISASALALGCKRMVDSWLELYAPSAPMMRRHLAANTI
ncbi:putative aarF domain-containing protein kinase [Acorus calamus]|uniref:AarF domain-containing protein kinase n=1 Tax=Acorus calamus TaxID=4465 RepID=A0AAV9CL54_ACOCL|nr:putative aarF domain-containing protein kinase [Acorus calamus]